MCHPSKPSSLETLIEKINLTLIGQVFDFPNFLSCESRRKGMSQLGGGITAHQFYL